MTQLLQEVDKPVTNQIASQSGLSHSQVQIWAGQAAHPKSPYYNMAFAFSIDGPIDEQVFQVAWQRVVDKSDALRTCIETVDGVPHRKLNKQGSCSLQIHYFTEKPDPKTHFRKWARQRCSHPFELSGELVESHLCKIDDEKFVWFINQHHLVTDAHSTTLIFDSVSNNYQSLLSNKTDCDRLASSYYDTCSSFTNDGAETHRNDTLLDSLSNQPRTCELYGRSGNPTELESERISLKLSGPESAEIRALTDDPAFANLFSNVSLFSIFSVALSSLIYRASGQTSFGIDAPAGNRPNKASLETIGCFIEMFPLESQISTDDTFRSLAERVQPEIRNYLSKVGPGRSSPNSSSSSNVVLNFFPGSFGKFSGFKTDVEWIHSDHIEGIYDLKLQVHDFVGDGELTFQFDLSTDTLPERIRNRVPKHFKSILRSMLENLDTPIDKVDLLTSDERQSILVDYNTTVDSSLPRDSVIQRLSHQARNNPSATAIREQERSCSYSELWEEINRNAQSLQSLGIKKDDPVLVFVKRSTEAVIAILSILRTGGAFVPVEPNTPESRLTSIINGCKPLLAIVSSERDVSKFQAQVPTYTLSYLAEAHQPNIPLDLPDPDGLAYIIYTSGSTGIPKGVEIEHRGLIDYIDWAERTYVRGNILSFPLFTSLSFDLTITSLFLPLTTGGTLHVYPQRDSEVDSAVIDVITDNAIDFIKLTPSHLSLLKHLDLSNSRIRRIVVGGEDLKRSLAGTIIKQLPSSTELYNEYGPTECVVGCMIHKFDSSPELSNERSVPIGRPAEHVSLFLLNEKQVPVPEGTPGELYVERAGMARGYRNDPEKTQISFLEIELGGSRRLYRTGDLARFSSKDALTYLGRVDKQVKIRGHRIELGEIEAALLKLPKIQEAVVTTTSKKEEPKALQQTVHCKNCGIESNYPNIALDENGVCSVCNAYETIKDKADAYFQDRAALKQIFREARERTNPEYDCMVFYSGGKDSSYALANLVDLGLKVYAFTLDNGYLSTQAMDNIQRVVKELQIDHEFATTPEMNEIFRDSLIRYSNVCNGCFKTIYTLGVKRAHELGIPIIVTGLSRGQFYETRLTESLFLGNRFSPQEVDTAVLEARKRYHREADAVAACIDTSIFKSDDIFEEIQFVDFYRYWDAPLENIYTYLENRLPWIRPSDTGRSTNCRVNDVGIYIHKKERGFHNYSLPYSWDVRLGQKKREEAIEELNDHYDLGEVRTMLSEIGYDEDRLQEQESPSKLHAYYVAPESLDPQVLSSHLGKLLPSYMVPTHFEHLESLPLTPNGKTDEEALASLRSKSNVESEVVPPQGPVEEHVSELWKNALNVSQVSTDINFFQYGGTSLSAMEIAIQLCRDFEIDLPLQSIFQHPTIAELSNEIERLLLEEIENLSDEEASNLLKEGDNG